MRGPVGVYAAAGADVVEAVERHGVQVAARVASLDLLYPLLVTGRASAILVAAESEDSGGLVDAVARIRLAAPSCPLVVLSGVEDAAALERAGATAVFRPPYDAGAIASFLRGCAGGEAGGGCEGGWGHHQAPAGFPAAGREALLRELAWSEQEQGMMRPSLPPGPGEGPLVAVFVSSKGGVGRSLLAALVSSSLAGMVGHVVLLDLDLSCGDLDVYLGGPPGGPDLSDVAAAGEGVDVGLLARCLRRLGPGFDFLPGPRRPETASSITEVHAAELMDWARRRYRVVVVDTGTDLGDPRLTPVFAAATHLIVPCLAEPASLRQGRLTLSVLASRRLLEGRHVCVVLNRVRRGRGGPGEAAEGLGVRPVLAIPEDGSLPGRSAGAGGFLGRLGGRLSPGMRGAARLARLILGPADGAWPSPGPPPSGFPRFGAQEALRDGGEWLRA